MYYLLTDHLGSTATTTDVSGNRVTELRYYPYGGARYNTGGQFTTYRFTGQRWDSGTAMYFYGSRWYDPVIGRFLQADSIVPEPGNPQALNRYSYVLNNPLRYTDPTGHAHDSGGGGGGWYPVPVPVLVPTPPPPQGTPTPQQIIANQPGSQPQIPLWYVDWWWQSAWEIQPRHTKSYGLSGNLGVGAAGTGGLQLVAVDGDGNLALLAVQAGGMGIAGGVADVTVWVQATNAPTIDYPLNNVTVFAGGSAALGPGLGLDVVSVGQTPSGQYLFGLQASAELGAAGNPLTLAEFHGGAYHTGKPLVRLNVYDLLGYTRPSQR